MIFAMSRLPDGIFEAIAHESRQHIQPYLSSDTAIFTEASSFKIVA
jgi:hypothetical protein